MAYLYRSAFPAFLLIIGTTLVGCGSLEPRVETFAIRAHSLDAPRCRVDTNPDVTLQALGSFPVSNLATERLRFRTGERTLGFPNETLGVDAVATDGESTWLGYSDRRTERGIDVLMWRERVGCELYYDEEAQPGSYPGPNGGQAIGYSPETGVLLVAGSNSNGSAAGGSLFFDSGTGRSELVDSRPFLGARAFATVTAFGAGLLLAGGESPLQTDVVEERGILRSAAIYDPALGGFADEVIELEFSRTRHAAVVMPGGETLLVGGGLVTTNGRELVTLFEIVSPETRRSTVNGVSRLANGRLHPTALLLDNGNLLVGGGYDVNGEPVSSVEWFASDGSCALSPSTNECTGDPPSVQLTPRHHRAFIAMPGGGALTVGGCEPAETQTSTCETACGPGFGCPATSADAAWISPNGELTTVPFEPSGPCGSFAPERALFAPGSDGSPWLLAYDEDPLCRTVYRFNPWLAIFESVEPSELDPSPWPDPHTPLTSLGPDAFVWLTESDPPLLVGTRASVRGALSHYETSLLSALSDEPQRPVHLAPDRPPQTADRPKAIFTPGSRLILEIPNEPDEPVVTVHVTDSSYDDVAVTLEFSGQGPPVLLLGKYEIGGRDCAWPDDPVSPLLAVRHGRVVTTSDDRGRSVTCANAPTGRVTVAIRAGETSTTLTSLVVQRR
jgi:hypothetical protein